MKREQSELKIRITQLSEGTHEYQFTSHPEQLRLGDHFQENVEIDVILDKTQRQLYLRTKISAGGKFECDRCAGDFTESINSSYNICYAYDENPVPNAEDDEIRLIHQGTPYLDLTEDIRQSIMLAVPMKLVCSDDCKGLCPQCGCNLNTTTCACTTEHHDSRWDELRKLITVPKT